MKTTCRSICTGFRTPVGKTTVFCLAEAVVFSVVVSALCYHEVVTGLRFGLFLVLFLAIPGMACTLLLSRHSCVKLVSDAEWAFSALFYGYCLNIILYILIMLAGMRDVAIVPMVAVVGLSVFYIYRQKGLPNPAQDNHTRFCFAFQILIFGLLLFTYCGHNLLPVVIEENEVPKDLLYWIGNTVELTKEFPPRNFRNYPAPYNYHYFSSAQMALISLCTGISPAIAGTSFTAVQSAILMPMGAYLCLQKLNPRKAGLLFGMIGTFFAGGFEKDVIVTYDWHMYICSFGYDYGLAVFLFLVFHLLQLFQENQEEGRSTGQAVKEWTVVLCLLFLTLGIKSSFGALALTGMGVICLERIIKNDRVSGFLSGVSALAVFCAGYFLVVNASGYSGGEAERIFNKGPIWQSHTSWMRDKICAKGVPGIMAVPVFHILYSLMTNPMVMTGAGITLFYVVIARRFSFRDAFFLTIIVTGLFVGINIGMHGNSNMYFTLGVFPVCAVWTASHFSAWSLSGKKTLLSAVLCMLLLTASVFSFRGFLYPWGETLAGTMHHGASNLGLMDNDSNRSVAQGTYINQSLYEAYLYVRDHTEENAILTGNNETLMPGVVTERYVRRLDESSNIEESGISCFVWDKTTESGLSEDPFKETGRILFENDAAIVYTVSMHETE